MTVPRRPVLVHLFGRYLPVSEVFLHELIGSLDAFEHHVLAAKSVIVERFPIERLHISARPEVLWETARRAGAQLIVCHFGPLGMSGLPMGLALRLPVVTMFYGYDHSMALREPHWVERYRTLAAMGVHAVSNSEFGRRRLVEIGWPPDQIAAIHLGVDTRRFAFTPRRLPAAGPLRLVMVSRLVPKKGVHIAVRAVDAVRRRGVAVQLRIVGEGAEREKIERLIASLGLQAHVTLLGAVRHSQVDAELAQAHLYLQPSVVAPNGDEEGLPVALTEAQAAGLPVIASRHAGIPELVVHDETGLLVDEADVAGLADAIERLASERDLASRLVHAARRRVERDFDLTVQSGVFARHFERLLRAPAVGTPLPHGTARRRLLFVRSVPVDAALRKLIQLRLAFPDAAISVFTSDSTVAAFRQCPLVNEVISYPDGPLRLRRVGAEGLRRLQAAQYDIAVVPYSNGDGAGFANVRRLARATGARRQIALNGLDVMSDLRAGSPRLQPLAAARRGAA